MANKGSFTLTDTKELGKVLDQVNNNIRKRVVKRGLRQAGARTRTLIRKSLPVNEGTLKKSIRAKSLRGGAVRVGLHERFYYETLDFASKRGDPLAPWFEDALSHHKKSIGNLIVEHTRNALAFEAGRTYQRSKRIRRR